MIEFLTITLSCCYCFLGFPFRKLILAIRFFGSSLSITTLILATIPQQELFNVLQIIVGIILVVLCFKFDKVMAAIMLFSFGLDIGSVLFSSFSGSSTILAIVLGIILALLTIKFFKTIFILYTSFMGAYLLSQIVILYFSTFTPYSIPITIIIWIIGIVIQYFASKNLNMDGKMSLI